MTDATHVMVKKYQFLSFPRAVGGGERDGRAPPLPAQPVQQAARSRHERQRHSVIKTKYDNTILPESIIDKFKRTPDIMFGGKQVCCMWLRTGWQGCCQSQEHGLCRHLRRSIPICARPPWTASRFIKLEKVIRQVDIVIPPPEQERCDPRPHGQDEERLHRL